MEFFDTWIRCSLSNFVLKAIFSVIGVLDSGQLGTTHKANSKPE